MVSEASLTKPETIAILTRSPHGQLESYIPVATAAVRADADFFAHLVSWSHVKSEVRDAKVALPLIALAEAMRNPTEQSRVHAENALAVLADLEPRLIAKGLLPRTMVIKDLKTGKPVKPIKTITLPPFDKVVGAPRRVLRRLVERYLRDLETDLRSFERVAVQHRHVLHELYASTRTSRPAWVGEILFHGEKGKPKAYPADGTIFGRIRALHAMPIEQAAGTIAKFKIPFLIARGALGAKAKEADTVLALIKAMSPTELVTNVKWLEQLGVKTVPALRSAFEEAIGKAAGAKKGKATLKTTKAAEVMAGDVELSGKLRVLQEKQIDRLGGVEGDWLVLGDKSGSMDKAIEVARDVAAILARVVKGKVHLIFFDTSPRYHDATNYTYEELKALVGHIKADGGTSIGCGLQAMMERGVKVDGIAIVSDGGENTAPYFGDVYAKYCAKLGVEPNVYLYSTTGDPDYQFTAHNKAAHLDVQKFDISHGRVDAYSLPDLVQSMRVGRYQLLDEILAVPLHTLDEVLDKTKGMPVLPRLQGVTV